MVLCAGVPGKSSEDWHSGQQLTATTVKLRCSHISATPRTFVIINLGCFKGKLGVTGYSGMNISNILSLMCLITIIKEE